MDRRAGERPVGAPGLQGGWSLRDGHLCVTTTGRGQGPESGESRPGQVGHDYQAEALGSGREGGRRSQTPLQVKVSQGRSR